MHPRSTLTGLLCLGLALAGCQADPLTSSAPVAPSTTNTPGGPAATPAGSATASPIRPRGNQGSTTPAANAVWLSGTGVAGLEFTKARADEVEQALRPALGAPRSSEVLTACEGTSRAPASVVSYPSLTLTFARSGGRDPVLVAWRVTTTGTIPKALALRGRTGWRATAKLLGTIPGADITAANGSYVAAMPNGLEYRGKLAEATSSSVGAGREPACG